MSEIMYKRRNFYECQKDQKTKAFEYAEKYMDFLDNSKTERDAVRYTAELAKKEGYVEYHLGDALVSGGKYYLNNRDKSLYLVKVGEGELDRGIKILAAHIDSPRLDLKQRPLFEDGGMAFLKTHYYGGIRKYQWTAVPLALHGVVVKRDESVVDVVIGEDENDPILYVNDLLPHLAKDQSEKPLGSAIKGEQLNLLLGSEPGDEESDAIKKNVMALLCDKYGIEEDDFVSAELCAVPAGKAREVGLDRSMIAGYGHDDKVCAYPSVTAIFETDNNIDTMIVVLADKEEAGSDGNTGMQSRLLCDLIDEICAQKGANPRVVRAHSFCVSSDVTAAFDPNFAEVYEKSNSAYLNCGVALSKYTGSRGKGGTSDASAETVGKIRRIFADNDVVWQSAELGKVDVGGGGTVAKYIANLNIDTIDIGVPVISMHAPCEVISKADLYCTHRAFVSFLNDRK